MGNECHGLSGIIQEDSEQKATDTTEKPLAATTMVLGTTAKEEPGEELKTTGKKKKIKNIKVQQKVPHPLAGIAAVLSVLAIVVR